MSLSFVYVVMVLPLVVMGSPNCKNGCDTNEQEALVSLMQKRAALTSPPDDSIGKIQRQLGDTVDKVDTAKIQEEENKMANKVVEMEKAVGEGVNNADKSDITAKIEDSKKKLDDLEGNAKKQIEALGGSQGQLKKAEDGAETAEAEAVQKAEDALDNVDLDEVNDDLEKVNNIVNDNMGKAKAVDLEHVKEEIQKWLSSNDGKEIMEQIQHLVKNHASLVQQRTPTTPPNNAIGHMQEQLGKTVDKVDTAKIQEEENKLANKVVDMEKKVGAGVNNVDKSDITAKIEDSKNKLDGLEGNAENKIEALGGSKEQLKKAEDGAETAEAEAVQKAEDALANVDMDEVNDDLEKFNNVVNDHMRKVKNADLDHFKEEVGKLISDGTSNDLDLEGIMEKLKELLPNQPEMA